MKIEMVFALMVSAALFAYSLYLTIDRREQTPRAFVALAVGFLMLAIAVSDMVADAADAPAAIALLQNEK